MESETRGSFRSDPGKGDWEGLLTRWFEARRRRRDADRKAMELAMSARWRDGYFKSEERTAARRQCGAAADGTAGAGPTDPAALYGPQAAG